MQNRKTKGIIAILLVMVITMVSGCGLFTKFDAGKYTKACLDTLYKGEFKDYIELTRLSEKDAQESYEAQIDLQVSVFRDLGLSEDLTASYKQLFTDLLKQTKYSVKKVEESGKNYKVTLEIEPIQIFEGLEDETTAQVTTKMEELVAAGGGTPDTEAINEIVFQIMYDILSERLENLTYGEKTTITVDVTNNGSNVYEISEDDYEKIDSMMFDMENLGM